MAREGFPITPEMIAAADKVFRRESRFIAGADNFGAIPDIDVPEVAFAGRSNVGKSSLINALTNRKNLARSSNTPGRTQQINFFDVADEITLADLPGYGYAKVSRTKSEDWNDMVWQYLSGRNNLKRVLVLIDGRHGILDTDRSALTLLDKAGVGYIAVLTKADKMKAAELQSVKDSVEAYLQTCANAFPVAYVTSAEKGIGIPELRAIIMMA